MNQNLPFYHLKFGRIFAANILAGNEEIPFKTFCLTLADYHQKSTHLEKLIMREHKIGKELDARLQEKCRQNGMLSSTQDSAAILDATLESRSSFSLEMSRQLQPASASDDLFQQQSTSAAAVKSVHFGAVNTKPLTPSTVTNSAEGSNNTNGNGGESDLLFKVPELLPKRRASPKLLDFSQEEEEPQPSGSNSQPANGQANRVVNLSADNLSFMDGPNNFLGDDDNAAAGEDDDAADALPTRTCSSNSTSVKDRE